MEVEPSTFLVAYRDFGQDLPTLVAEIQNESFCRLTETRKRLPDLLPAVYAWQ